MEVFSYKEVVTHVSLTCLLREDSLLGGLLLSFLSFDWQYPSCRYSRAHRGAEVKAALGIQLLCGMLPAVLTLHQVKS